MKYRVGDKVKIVSKKVGNRWNVNGLMDKWLGKVMTVKEVYPTYCKMEEDKNEWSIDGWNWYPEMIERRVDFTKLDLIPGEHVITTKGRALYLCLRNNSGNLFFQGLNHHGFLVDDYCYDLKHRDFECHDIVRVYEFSEYSAYLTKANLNLIWEREPKVQKPKQLENIVDPCDFFKEV